MTSTRERLEQLQQADFDTFGNPVGPGEIEPDITPDEWLAIREEIWHRPWDDPARFPDCLVEAVKVLGEIGTSNTDNPARAATQCLRRMVYRAKNGGWPGEQEAEPAWSLDRDEPRYHHVLGPDELEG